jgi:F0F1-type ATP synthase membrane subunit b/b'
MVSALNYNYQLMCCADNKRCAVSVLSPVAAKRARLDSDAASSSDEIITISSDDDDEIQLLSSTSGFWCCSVASQQNATAELQASRQNATAELPASRQNATAELQASRQNATAELQASRQNATAELQASRQNATAELQASRQNATAELQASRQNATAELQASRQNARATKADHSSTFASNPQQLYSNARVVGFRASNLTFRASNFTFRNNADTGDKHYLVDCLEDWLMNALRRPAGVNDDIVSQFLSTLGTEVSALSSQAFTQLVNCVSQLSNQCAIMVQFAKAAAPRKRETTLPIARNELLTLLDKLLSEPTDGLLCKLDLVMTLIESDLTSRSPLGEQQLMGAMVNRLFPDKTSFWIVDLVKCVVTASELTEGSTCSPYHSRVCQHISHLLSLITAASRDPTKIASEFAWKMLLEWKALPRAACRSRVLRLLAGAPLLLLRVTQRIVDGLCPHPRLNWIGGVYFASLASIVDTYFRALPPHMDPHSSAPRAPESPLCSPPSSPDSLLSRHNDLNGNCDDGSEGDVNKLTRLYTAEAVEEFASLLYLLVENYITVAVGK